MANVHQSKRRRLSVKPSGGDAALTEEVVSGKAALKLLEDPKSSPRRLVDSFAEEEMGQGMDKHTTLTSLLFLALKNQVRNTQVYTHVRPHTYAPPFTPEYTV